MTCKFHIEDSDYDEPISYFCNLDETFKNKYYTKIVYGKDFEEQGEWFVSHQVCENSLCDDFVAEDRSELLNLRTR
jgi:hypothetical protein